MPKMCRVLPNQICANKPSSVMSLVHQVSISTSTMTSSEFHPYASGLFTIILLGNKRAADDSTSTTSRRGPKAQKKEKSSGSKKSSTSQVEYL